MSGPAIENWLSLKQRKALFSARLYFAATLAAGMVALLPNLGIAFLIGKLALLMAFPTAAYPDLWAGLLATPFTALLFADCIRAERDDMAVFPPPLRAGNFYISAAGAFF